jgi:hypothetical protein
LVTEYFIKLPHLLFAATFGARMLSGDATPERRPGAIFGSRSRAKILAIIIASRSGLATGI